MSELACRLEGVTRPNSPVGDGTTAGRANAPDPAPPTTPMGTTLSNHANMIVGLNMQMRLLLNRLEL